MSKKPYFNRGILFISTLCISVVVLMLIGAALLLLPSRQLSTDTIEFDAAANRAAVAGIEYAKAQLQANKNWRGGASHDKVVVDMPGELWIREDHGNVIGLVWAKNGDPTPSMFRMRFNFQNQSQVPDEGLSNPSSQMFIPIKHISINNLATYKLPKLYLGDGANHSVTGSSGDFGSAPQNAAVLYCEGLSGPALREVTHKNLTLDSSQKLTARLLEVYIGYGASTYGDAVLYGGNSIDIKAKGKVTIKNSGDKLAPTKIRSLANVAVTGIGENKFKMQNGEVYVYGNNPKFTIDGSDSTNPEATIKDSANSFVKLGWGDLNPPDLDAAALGGSLPDGMQKLDAGTYVWRKVEGQFQLDYYAEDYNSVVPNRAADITDITAATLSQNGIILKKGDLSLTFTKDLGVIPKGSAKGLAIVAEPDIINHEGLRPTNILKPSQLDAPAPKLYSEGNVQVVGTLRGNGSVMSNQSIQVQGTSIVEADPHDSVALFAKKNIEIKAIPASVAQKIADTIGLSTGSGVSIGTGSYSSSDYRADQFPIFSEPPNFKPTASDVALLGVTYAQGDIKIDLDPSSASDNNLAGNLYLKGMMLAYGGDYEPQSGKRLPPGSNGEHGKISLTINKAKIEYDASYIEQLRSADSGLPLNFLSWRPL